MCGFVQTAFATCGTLILSSYGGIYIRKRMISDKKNKWKPYRGISPGAVRGTLIAFLGCVAVNSTYASSVSFPLGVSLAFSGGGRSAEFLYGQTMLGLAGSGLAPAIIPIDAVQSIAVTPFSDSRRLTGPARMVSVVLLLLIPACLYCTLLPHESDQGLTVGQKS